MWRKVAVMLAASMLIGLWLIKGGQPAGAAPSAGMSAAVPAHTGKVWQPPRRIEWQWEIDHPLSPSNRTDMGVGLTAWNGDRPPGTNPSVYDVDGILNPAS